MSSKIKNELCELKSEVFLEIQFKCLNNPRMKVTSKQYEQWSFEQI